MVSALFSRHSVAGLILVGFSTAASAASVQVSVTNNQGADGLYLTPLLSIMHDGSFDTFDVGSAASASLEALAEEGDASLVAADAAAAGATNIGSMQMRTVNRVILRATVCRAGSFRLA